VLTRRGFVEAALATGAALSLARRARAQPGASFELAETSLAALAAGLREGRYTSKRLVELYLGRIAAIDADTVRSMLAQNPDAARDAERLDAERAAGKLRGPLHGVPIVVKGNLDTADRMPTTAGSLALAGHLARQDAHVVERLRAAGCVLLGKSNLSEWANIRSTTSSSGWSAEGGQTRNAYALDRSPSGSSSGSASAVAANLAAAAIGTETDGSILSPSSCQGLVGLKPTVGLVSRSGIIPIAHSQDTAGPMTRTVADAALLLHAIAGPDPRDPATARARVADYPAALAGASLKGVRLGVLPRDDFSKSPHAERLFTEALAALRHEGAEIIDPVEPTRESFGAAELEVLLYELKADLAAYLAARDAPVKSLADVIAFNQANAAREMPFFGQELFLMAEKKGPLTSPEYRKARASCVKLARGGLEKALRGKRLDALVAPTGGPAWLIDHVNGDAYGYSSTSLAAVAGTPSITVPAGLAAGLPIGVSFMGPAFGEARLCAIAHAFERATQARRPAALRPTAAT
jgi:amidase